MANHCAVRMIKESVFADFVTSTLNWTITMLRLAIVFLVIALIAAVFGFGGVAAVATDAARILFFVFIVLFLITLVMGRKGLSVK
jgi:uncharacterized membrane protein YtjA (UPF0391 family)